MQLVCEGRVYFCDNCLGFPGTLTATLSPDKTVLSGTCRRDDTSFTFEAVRQE